MPVPVDRLATTEAYLAVLDGFPTKFAPDERFAYCNSGYVVLASDCTHLYRHFETGRVFPTTYNPAEVVEGYDTLRRLATSDAHVVPGHDPEVLKRYPAAKPGLEGWVVRLDEAPKA